jgi:hypothetical protein
VEKKRVEGIMTRNMIRLQNKVEKQNKIKKPNPKDFWAV